MINVHPLNFPKPFYHHLSFIFSDELCVDNNTFVHSQEFVTFVKRYDDNVLRTSRCNSDVQYFVETLFSTADTTVSTIHEENTEKFSKLPNIHTGISNFFLGSYLSIILIVQAIVIILLTLYYIKIRKYEKVGSGSDDDINYANTILNDNDIYKVYKLDE